MESPYPHLSSKESLINRYKPIWRILLISNLALGAYMFAKARRKNLKIEERKTAKRDLEDCKTAEKDCVPETSPTPAVLKAKEPIPEDQQRELFKWILEGKRKIKPKDPEERKRIDEEKAILKKFIRAKSLPSF